MEDLEALLARESGEQAIEGDETMTAPAEPIEPIAAASSEEGGDVDEAMPRASSASLGPHVAEPINRPLYDEVTAQLEDAVDEEDEDDLDAEDDGHARG